MDSFPWLPATGFPRPAKGYERRNRDTRQHSAAARTRPRKGKRERHAEKASSRGERDGNREGRAVLISDILHNNVKAKLARDEVVASMTVRLVRTIEIARIARTAGFDSLYVDLEHSSFSLETCGQICIAALEPGSTPFVRVPANTPDYISRVLDGGALGVIVPHIRPAGEGPRGGGGGQQPPLSPCA